MANSRVSTFAAGLGSLILGLASCLALGGCSVGFIKTSPDEGENIYGAFFEEVSGSLDRGKWLWVRGAIAGDFDGDGKVGEEAAIATVQGGGIRSPEPVEAAYLAWLALDEDGGRRPLCLTEIFLRNPLSESPRPENGLDRVEETRFTQVRAQIIRDKLGFKEEVVVYFWGDRLPGSVWYAGYGLDDENRPRRILETALYLHSGDD